MGKPSVLLILGSVRSGRKGTDVMEWVKPLIEKEGSYTVEAVDLANYPLPLNDEPGVPAYGPGVYTQDHTKAWSAKVASASGFIFLTPEYNGGYPAALKNALDHLYNEWKGKSALVISYGAGGGARAAAQLRQVLEGGLNLRTVATSPALPIREAFDEAGKLKPAALDAHVPAITAAVLEFAKGLSAPPAEYMA